MFRSRDACPGIAGMTAGVVVMLLLFACSPPALGEKMTYEQAKKGLKAVDLPDFWVGDVAGLADRWKGLKAGKCRVIATSPGGRPLHLITYGQRERVRHRANFNSAVGGRDPSAYMDKDTRKRPVIFFVGPVHGHEVEALTGLVNLIQVMEMGRDLRGREQKNLQEAGRQCRLLIVPAGNPDGIARFEPRAALGMPLAEMQFWGQGTWSNNEIAYWPTSKRQHPFTGPETGFMGCYFNDRGINPMHDEFFHPMGPEAPAILKVAMEEGPDLAVSLHSHEAAPTLLRPAYVPLQEQEKVASLARQYYEVLDKHGLAHGKPFKAQAESGRQLDPFNLLSALYHISGATSFTFECPQGIDDPKACRVSLEDILDIQLLLYETMMKYAIEAKPE